MKRVLKQVEEAGVPVVAVWLQDWVGKRYTMLGQRLWWNWALDRQSYAGHLDLTPAWHGLV